MFKLHIIQAEYGDCLLLEFGSQNQPKYILIDGGPDGTFEQHLRGHLESTLGTGGVLELVILSHVDNDHVIGLLDMLAELREQRINNLPELVTIGALWHNSFSKTIGEGTNIESRINTLAAITGQSMSLASAVQGINQGHQLGLSATAQKIPINPGFSSDLVCVDDAQSPTVIDNLKAFVVGPTRANLDKLKRKWLKWLDDHEDTISTGDIFAMVKADQSKQNLSSIMVLAEAEGKRILLTGDGRSDHLLLGLRQANLLNATGELHVDILKLPHHGSVRNATRTFFEKVTANNYVISANGRDENPDLATLIWIVEAAKEQNRQIEIVVTNETNSTKKLLEEYTPIDFGYQLTTLAPGSHALTLTLV